MAIGQKLEDCSITTLAAIGAALGMLTRHQWREGDVARLQAAPTRRKPAADRDCGRLLLTRGKGG
jgi:hypothetical protein